MATEPKTTGLTYEDLQRFPEDNLRRELIDGELIVTPAPSTRHQDVVLRLGATLLAWCDQNGGKVYVAPTDVLFSETNVAEPDVLFLRPENVQRAEERFVRGSPDVVVEVSSPSTRRLELIRKRELYQRFQATEYWYVDRDADRVEIYRLDGGRYATPRYLARGDKLESPEIPGFSISVNDLLGPSPEA
jgi:Uma2 family endonuclease